MEEMSEPKSFTNTIMCSRTYLMGAYTLVDCGDWHDDFAAVKAVLLTHAHFDHIFGLEELLKHIPDVRIYTNEAGREMLLSVKLNLSWAHETPFALTDDSNITVVDNGEKLVLPCGIDVKAVYTPGHNPSCVTWLTDGYIFTGDSYIPGVATVTKLPRGNRKEAEKSLELIKMLAADRRVCPGHDTDEARRMMAQSAQCNPSPHQYNIK